MTPFSKVYTKFLGRIEDHDLYLLEEEDRLAILYGYLDEAITFLEFQDITLENDYTAIDEEEQCFIETLSRKEIKLLSLAMVVVWYDVRINSIEHTSLFIGTNSEKWTKQKEHLEMMTETRDYWKIEIQKLYRDMHIRSNAYLNGG